MKLTLLSGVFEKLFIKSLVEIALYLTITEHVQYSELDGAA